MTRRRAAVVMAVTVSVAVVLAACRTGADVDADGAREPAPTSVATAASTDPVVTTGTAAAVTAAGPTTTAAPATTAAPTTAATPATTGAAETTTTAAVAGPNQPRTAEEARRVIESFPATEESPPFDPLLADDLDVGLRGIIADPARTKDFFAEVRSGRPVGVIAMPYLVCDVDRGGAPCVASVDDYVGYMAGCHRPGTVHVRRIVVTDAGWAAVGVCAIAVGPEHLAHVTELVRTAMGRDGRPTTDDADLQQLATDWVTHESEQEALAGIPPAEADDQAFTERLQSLAGGRAAKCWRIIFDADPFLMERLVARLPLEQVAGDALRFGLGAAPAVGLVRMRLCVAAT